MSRITLTQIEPQKIIDELILAMRQELNEFEKRLRIPQQEEYLTRKELAKLLSINLSTIHNWRKDGKIISHKIGNRVVFKRSEIEQCLILLKTKAIQ